MIGSSLDMIASRIQSMVDGSNLTVPELRELSREIDEDRHAVESILLCASHQGRIADDILNGEVV